MMVAIAFNLIVVDLAWVCC